MKETKAALVEARNENQRLENKTIGQIVKVREAEHKLEELKLKLLEKDISIKDLTNQINSGQKSEKIKYLEEKLERLLHSHEAIFIQTTGGLYKPLFQHERAARASGLPVSDQTWNADILRDY